jgi:hypothetical protein
VWVIVPRQAARRSRKMAPGGVRPGKGRRRLPGRPGTGRNRRPGLPHGGGRPRAAALDHSMAFPAGRSPTFAVGRGAGASRSASVSACLASARKGRVNRYRLMAGMVAGSVLALVACVPTVQAAPRVASSSVSASAGEAGGCAPRVGPHRARDHVRTGATLRHRPVTPGVPAHGHPVHPRTEHHAALPVPARGHHRAPTLRVGHVLPVSAMIPSGTAITARLDALPDDSCAVRAGRVTSGRGPPRARAIESLAPALHGRPSEFLRSAVHSRGAPPASRVLPASRARPCPPMSHLPSFVFIPPEPLPVRSRVRRPEGTAARFPTPSHGESL